MGHVLMENRHGLVVDGDLTGPAARGAGHPPLIMLAERPGTQRITVGGDKLYDTKGFVANFANSGRPRMWHRMTPTDARPSMHALPT